MAYYISGSLPGYVRSWSCRRIGEWCWAGNRLTGDIQPRVSPDLRCSLSLSQRNDVPASQEDRRAKFYERCCEEAEEYDEELMKRHAFVYLEGDTMGTC